MEEVGKFCDTWSILRPFDVGILEPFGVIYIVHFSRVGKLYQDKSGNPG
jgi:hypothetical protein